MFVAPYKFTSNWTLFYGIFVNFTGNFRIFKSAEISTNTFFNVKSEKLK